MQLVNGISCDTEKVGFWIEAQFFPIWCLAIVLLQEQAFCFLLSRKSGCQVELGPPLTNCVYHVLVSLYAENLKNHTVHL